MLGRIAAAAPATAIITSNTSSLPIEGLAVAVSDPARFLGVHWFNPPEWTPGIEVIPASGDGAARTVDPRDRVPARCRQAPGRGRRPSGLRRPTGSRWRSCARRSRSVDEGLATPESLDEVVRTTFGFRLPFFGPFLIADMAGLDTNASVVRDARARHRAGVRGARPVAASWSTPAASAPSPVRASASTPTRSATRCCSPATATTRRSRSCSPRAVDVCGSPHSGDPFVKAGTNSRLGRSG